MHRAPKVKSTPFWVQVKSSSWWKAVFNITSQCILQYRRHITSTEIMSSSTADNVGSMKNFMRKDKTDAAHRFNEYV